MHVTANGKKIMKAEINFLCVHKSLRAKRLAPVLIKEVTRRVNRCNNWQAIYTAGVVIPTPIAVTTYWHRSLNPKKLVEVGFSSLPAKTPMARFIKSYKLPDNTSIKGLRPLEQKDVGEVFEKLNKYLTQFKMHIQFQTVEEFAHFFMPREWVIESFVVEDESNGEITDFFSFYSLPSSILRHPIYNTLNVAYSYYYFNKKYTVTELTKEALILAKNKGYDVFNCLDVMQNSEQLQELKFGMGDGNLHYYFYNWRVNTFDPKEIGMVLV